MSASGGMTFNLPSGPFQSNAEGPLCAHLENGVPSLWTKINIDSGADIAPVTSGKLKLGLRIVQLARGRI